ncbi:MAG: AEC family transporter [Treponema sp.]|nr:AEC family transporter [Treponema sp.]
MLSNFLFTCNAVLPIILTILTGYVLKTLGVFRGDFFTLLNKLSFRCCLPTMLFLNVYGISNLDEIKNYGGICLFAFVIIMVTFIIASVLAAIFVKDKKQKGVMTQAAYRSNNAIIGLSLVMSLAGENAKAIGVVSVLTAVFIPLFNILAVISLTMFIDDGKTVSAKEKIMSTLRKTATNPLIIGCGLGFVFLLIRALIPTHVVNGAEVPVFTMKENIPFLYKTLHTIGGCATPIALIALGGNFAFSAVARLKTLITIGTLTRIIIVPAVTLVAARILGFGENEFPALIALFGTPVAVSSVPMATEMGNDAELAGQIVVWTSVFSAVTLFATIFACTQLGIF